MRKIAIIGLCGILLTGCSYSEEEASVQARFPNKIYTIAIADKDYYTREDEKWEKLTDALEAYQEKVYTANEEKDIDIYADDNYIDKYSDIMIRYRDEYDRTFKLGIVHYNGFIQIGNVRNEMGQEQLEIVAQTVGDEIKEFVKSCENLECNEYREQQINGYGVLVNKCDGWTEVNIASSGISLKDTKEKAWVDKIKGNSMLLSEVSVGENERIYELSDTAHLVESYSGDLNGLRYYYQIFKENTGSLTKARCIITQTQEGYKSKEIDESKLEPLKNLAAEFAGKDVDVTDLENDLKRVIEGKKSSCKGTLDGTQYNIQVDNSGYYNLIIVTLQEA